MNYTWSTSEPDIAQTDRFGKISTSGIGTAYVKVEADDGNYSSYRMNVKYPPTSLYLSEKSLELKVGETKQLREILINTQASYRNSFISTNPTVISVNSEGLVKARGKGEAKVICKSCSGVLAECEVTVK